MFYGKASSFKTDKIFSDFNPAFQIKRPCIAQSLLWLAHWLDKVVQIPIAARDFFLPQKVQTCSGAPPASYSKENGIHSRRSSSQGIIHSHRSSSQVIIHSHGSSSQGIIHSHRSSSQGIIHSHRSSSQGITFTTCHHLVLSSRMDAAFQVQKGTTTALHSKLNQTPSQVMDTH